MAPVVSVNLADVVDAAEAQIGHKPGTVGHPIPGVAVKIVDPDTGHSLPPGQEGMIIATGANRMLGYIGQPELTEQALRNGWYITGDIGLVGEGGFIRITEPPLRFSKSGGGIISH